jgi:hypothetical protein
LECRGHRSAAPTMVATMKGAKAAARTALTGRVARIVGPVCVWPTGGSLPRLLPAAADEASGTDVRMKVRSRGGEVAFRPNA